MSLQVYRADAFALLLENRALHICHTDPHTRKNSEIVYLKDLSRAEQLDVVNRFLITPIVDIEEHLSEPEAISLYNYFDEEHDFFRYGNSSNSVEIKRFDDFKLSLVKKALAKVRMFDDEAFEATKQSIQERFAQLPLARQKRALSLGVDFFVAKTLANFPTGQDPKTRGMAYWRGKMIGVQDSYADKFCTINEEVLHVVQLQSHKYLKPRSIEEKTTKTPSTVIQRAAADPEKIAFLDGIRPVLDGERPKRSLLKYWEEAEPNSRENVFLAEAFANIDNAIRYGASTEEIAEKVPDLFKLYERFIEEEAEILKQENALETDENPPISSAAFTL